MDMFRADRCACGKYREDPIAWGDKTGRLTGLKTLVRYVPLLSVHLYFQLM
jgi:hypothetical protein